MSTEPEIKDGASVLTPDGRTVTIWNVSADNGVRCSDGQWYCASALRHPSEAPMSTATKGERLTDAEIKAFAREHGAFDGSDYRGLILWENRMADGGGFFPFARAIEEAVLSRLPTPSTTPELTVRESLALGLVHQSRRVSISTVQRHLRIGYNAANELLQGLLAKGLIPKEYDHGLFDAKTFNPKAGEQHTGTGGERG
jgi:hypothetical protein